MMKIACIVEGHGEVTALPALLRRFNEWRPSTTGNYANPLQPVRVPRNRFLNREEEFRKQLLLAAAKCGEDGWILVVLDADDDCPAELASELYRRAQAYVAHRKLSVVLANREFEAWFIAAACAITSGQFSWPLTTGSDLAGDEHKTIKANASDLRLMWHATITIASYHNGDRRGSHVDSRNLCSG